MNRNGGKRYDIPLTQADISYLLNLLGADIMALRAQKVPRSHNPTLLRAYRVRDIITKNSGKGLDVR